MIGVVVGVEEGVDSFLFSQPAKDSLFARRVHEKGLSTFDQKGVAIRVGGELSEIDFNRADFLNLDHVSVLKKPVCFLRRPPRRRVLSSTDRERIQPSSGQGSAINVKGMAGDKTGGIRGEE
jgi:hypothetical protein